MKKQSNLCRTRWGVCGPKRSLRHHQRQPGDPPETTRDQPEANKGHKSGFLTKISTNKDRLEEEEEEEEDEGKEK